MHLFFVIFFINGAAFRKKIRDYTVGVHKYRQKAFLYLLDKTFI